MSFAAKLEAVTSYCPYGALYRRAGRNCCHCMSITTTSVNNRADWYVATATVKGHTYTSFMSSRLAALSDVLRQLAVKGYLTF